jgi:hypothetical protein
LATDLGFSQNYPNPFNVSTKITYSLSLSSYVRLEVFNICGQKIATLVDGQQSPGAKEILLDASEMTSGLYFYRLTAGEFSETKKITLLK